MGVNIYREMTLNSLEGKTDTLQSDQFTQIWTLDPGSETRGVFCKLTPPHPPLSIWCEDNSTLIFNLLIFLDFS